MLTDASSQQRPRDPKGLLADTSKSDDLRHIKFGTPSDPNSVAALYRADGRDEGPMAPHPEFDGILVVLVLQEMAPFALKRNGRTLSLPATSHGAFGIHDLRNIYSSQRRELFTLNLVFSNTYLEDLQFGPPRIMDSMMDLVDYTTVDETLHHLAAALLPAFEAPEAADKLFVDHVLLAAGAYLLGRYSGHRSVEARLGAMSYRQERAAKEFMASRLQDNICLAEVADACGLSPSHFARSFKRTSGVSPYRWLILRRIDLAKTLLETTEKPLADVAGACGFSDQSHFTRIFSRIVGLPPGAWRRSRRS